mmetsp:Transcript_100112/g.238636  ORF Transcript_100112/g.238636 Transcript_100112/m.238636 type:complete len:293 (+) Transcript_100112:733-1611(+)
MAAENLGVLLPVANAVSVHELRRNTLLALARRIAHAIKAYLHRLLVATLLWQSNELGEHPVKLQGTPALLLLPRFAALLCGDALAFDLELLLQPTSVEVGAGNASIHAVPQHHPVLGEVPHRELGVLRGVAEGPEEFLALRAADVSIEIPIDQAISLGDPVRLHVPGILRGGNSPQEGFVITHLLVGIEDDGLQRARRQSPQHVVRHALLDLPADPLHVIVDAHHIGASREEFHDEVPGVFVAQHRQLDAHLLPGTILQGLAVVPTLRLVGYEECDSGHGDPLPGEHAQRVR